MRIVLDLQGAQTTSRMRGIGRYSLSLAQAICRNRGAHDVRVVLSDMFPETIEPLRAAFEDILPQENIHVWSVFDDVNADRQRNNWRSRAAELIREDFIARLNPDILHVSSVFEGYKEEAVVSIGALHPGIPTAVTCYDFIPLIYADRYLKPVPSYDVFYRARLETFKRADFHLAISEATRLEAMEYAGVEADRVVNISAACEPAFRRLDIPAVEQQDLRRQFGLNRPFVLYVSEADERKNHARLIAAFSLMPEVVRKSHQLVLAGRFGEGREKEFRSHFHKCGLSSSDVVMTGRVTDEEMVRLYNMCKLSVFPSWHEGFGLPVLEAMACGTPVIASGRSSLPEIVGRQDALFDPFDENAIAAAMSGALSDPGRLEALSRHGLSRARDFSWDKCGIDAIRAFERWHLLRPPVRHTGGLGALADAIAAIPGGNEPGMLKAAAAIARNLPQPGGSQLLLDLSELVRRDAGTGIQRVVRSVLTEALQNPPQGFAVTPVYAVPGIPGYRHARKFMHGFLGQQGPEPEDDLVDVAAGDVFLGLDLQSNVIRFQTKVLDEWRRRGVKIHYVVYDLLPMQLPHCFRDGAEKTHREWCETIARFDGVACISRTVADEFHDWLDANDPGRLRPFAINWFHLGADIGRCRPAADLESVALSDLQALGEKPTFLMVGTVEPRKGHAQALAAFELLWQQGVDCNLAIVGKPGWMMDSFVQKLRQHPELGQRLFWLNKLDDVGLEKAYALSASLIAASEGEGFGLPLIESAHHGLPVIARDLPVFREVAGGHAYFFSGTEARDLADAVRAWLSLHAAGTAPSSKGMPWLTWKQSTASLMKAVLGGENYRTWRPAALRGDRGDITLKKKTG